VLSNNNQPSHIKEHLVNLLESHPLVGDHSPQSRYQ